MSMTKCFKAVLLEAYIELDGFNTPPTVETLAEKSWHVLARYPRLKAIDLSKTYQDLRPDSAKWIKYWRDNPINAFIGGNK